MISVFTIGHSNLDWSTFQGLLDNTDTGVLIDVRSSPRSRFSHFCRHELRLRLNRSGISYVYLGDQLGGHPKAGAANYEAMAKSAPFLAGIAQVLAIASRSRPVLMCAEHEPLECHRCLLIGRHLREQHDVTVRHILRDGIVEPHQHAETRLLALHGGSTNLFQSREERLAEAYRLQARKMGMGG